MLILHIFKNKQITKEVTLKKKNRTKNRALVTLESEKDLIKLRNTKNIEKLYIRWQPPDYSKVVNDRKRRLGKAVWRSQN